MNTGQHLLGPHVVGTRVVVRRVVPGERGPTGGPALTDLLGECVAWTAATDGSGGSCVVRPADGPDVEIALRDIVSGKPVPPRPSVRSRVTPEQAQRHAFALFPDLVTEPVGAWVLRDSATATARRAHSALAFGPSGVEDDVDRVVAHYERPIVAVLSHSPEHERFLRLGWVPESRDGDTVFQVAGTAQVARALRRGTSAGSSPGSTPEPVLEEAVPGAWARVRIGDLATGYAGFADDWVGFAGIEVAPHARRAGLGRAVMAALLDWGAEQGATTAYLQVLDDNRPALALYEALGFREHHRYCYLTAPVTGSED